MLSLNSRARLIFGFAFGLALAEVYAQSPDGYGNRAAIRKAANDHPSAFAYLRELSDTIGPRLTGSPQERRAGEWALESMRSAGLQRVHAESWQLEQGWRRQYARCRIISPFPLELIVTSYAWAGSTPAREMEAEVVLVDRNDLSGEARNSKDWAGKVLLLAASDGGKADQVKNVADLPPFLDTAAKAHAVAVIYRDQRPGDALTHTGPLGFPSRSTSLAVVDIAREQEALLTRLLRSGARVRVGIDVLNEFTSGPVESRNIVGEIPGSEFPEEVIVVGAHLDSWDLATGAIDDGFGVAAALAAAKSMVTSRAKPRRTIRFVIFTGEEEGLLGSRAYVRAHESELKNIVSVLVLDWGNGPITKIPIAGHDEFSAPLRDLLSQITDVAALQVTDGYLTYTDAFAFTLAGIAGIAPLQDTPNYAMVGHSAADTLDKVTADVLEKDSEILALLAMGIADRPTRIGARWTSEKTAQSLLPQRDLLVALGLWPFGRQ
ncbi:MAG TPA: M20/M25/M40 family metallo-hydrolase [Bryobacteraceae bacterium]|nr:M20/M25/M40 family metallo-hydrolase [Bryobacteraceae bacterium]